MKKKKEKEKNPQEVILRTPPCKMERTNCFGLSGEGKRKEPPAPTPALPRGPTPLTSREDSLATPDLGEGAKVQEPHQAMPHLAICSLLFLTKSHSPSSGGLSCLTTAFSTRSSNNMLKSSKAEQKCTWQPITALSVWTPRQMRISPPRDPDRNVHGRAKTGNNPKDDHQSRSVRS